MFTCIHGHWPLYSQNKNWKEFTVFMYLPGMDTNGLAYGVGEFRPNGLKEFKIQSYSLIGTKWESR